MRMHVVINPKYEKLRNFINAIPFARPQELGEVVYKARNTVYKKPVDGVELSIKDFKVPVMVNRIAYTYFRKSKARRSYDNATALIAMGFHTPAPVAYVEVYEHGLLSHSYYVCQHIEASDIREWERKPDCAELLDHLADYMIQLWHKGVWHKDFSPGNVLYDKDYNFYLIDLNRMKFGVNDRQKFMQNFGRLSTSRSEVKKLALMVAAKLDAKNPDAFVDEAVGSFDDYWRHYHRRHKIERALGLRK